MSGRSLMLEKVPRREVVRGSTLGNDSSWKRWSSRSDTGVLNLVRDGDPDLGVSVILSVLSGDCVLGRVKNRCLLVCRD